VDGRRKKKGKREVGKEERRKRRVGRRRERKKLRRIEEKRKRESGEIQRVLLTLSMIYFNTRTFLNRLKSPTN